MNPLITCLILQSGEDKSAQIVVAFIIVAILSLLFIGGILFLIIYGLAKNKRKLWVTGVIIAGVSVLIYLATYCGRYNKAVKTDQNARERINMNS